ncbi:hypothetical protein GCM10010404_28400 [Nonomuraea africana]|uniref:Uncharacterized protein n=1 Tax=Nonomuraea africana TaxID=46171 RepID=A0ABR9KEU9_9ACTN|nr:hypothetical protein [Nonomuraea africana]MBE1560559.1 hypothetical protein [Nonomuraea africana]
MSGQDVTVVVDPGVPEEVAWTLKSNAEQLARLRRGRPPEREPDDDRQPWGLVLMEATGLVALGLVFAAAGLFPLVVLTTGAILMLLLARALPAAKPQDEARAAERELFEQARWYDGRYYLREDFDAEALPLLARTQRAINSVLGSHVNAEGLLDNVRNFVMLPQQEWEIARLLAKLSSLRAEHNDLIAGGVAPEVAQAVRPLERALLTSEAAVVARVEALERYAGHVAEAERAYHARGQIEELRARLPRYEELVAESGADGFAVPEISGLADDADRLETALRRSVSSAHEAFRYLDG